MAHTTFTGKSIRAALLAAALLAAAALAVSCAGTPAPSKNADLSTLVKNNDLEGIQQFYANRDLLDRMDEKGLYPLHNAVVRGNVMIAEFLVSLGAKPDRQDPAGKTALRYAVDRGQAAMASMLVAKGADPFSPDTAGTTPALAAIVSGPEMTKAVFNERNINLAGPDGRTALHIAADRLLESEVDLLLGMNASPQSKDKSGRSPLDLALKNPHQERIEAARIAEKLIQRNATTSFPEFRWFVDAVRGGDFGSYRYADGNSPLHEAVISAQYGFVNFLLSRNVNKDEKNTTGDAPLHLAVRAGWVEGAELLLSDGADPEIRDGRDNTPLHLVVPEPSRLRMTKLFLRFFADPSLKDVDGNTPLHIAVRNGYSMEMIETLIGGKAPVNATNNAGDTVLMTAIKAGAYQYAAPLIAANSDILQLNAKGESPLSIAVGQGPESVGRIVLERNASQTDKSGNSVLATAVRLGCSPEVARLILSRGADPNTRNNEGITALHLAVRKNLGPVGIILLNAGADVFSAYGTDSSPLLLALTAAEGPLDWFFTPSVVAARDNAGNSALHHAARKNLASGITYLVGKGADPKAVNASGETALHSAVRMDATDACRLLVGMGLDLLARDNQGDTPLNAAVLANAKASMTLLVEAGSDLDARNFKGEAAIHQAAGRRNGETLQYLLAKGASKEARDIRGQTALSTAAAAGLPDMAQILAAAGAFVEARDYSGKTPLFHAVVSGNTELIRLLVRAGADILARDSAGNSPLTMVFRKGASLVREILTPETVNRGDSEGRVPLRLLIDAGFSSELMAPVLAAGADPNIRDRTADTPLHAAIRLGDMATAAMLVKAGADPFAPNSEGFTPVSLALSRGRDTFVALVQAAGIGDVDTLGNGFLHYAAVAGDGSAVTTLLALGADRDAVNIAGKRALDIAREKRNAALPALEK